MKFRVVSNTIEFKAQFKFWWWPFWLTCQAGPGLWHRTFDSKEAAEEYIKLNKKHLEIKKLKWRPV